MPSALGVSFVIYALQQGLSLWFVNQAVPLAVGIFGSFVGLFALFFPQWVQRCVIWGYYGVLIQAGMNWDPVTRATEFYWVQTQPLEFGLLAPLDDRRAGGGPGPVCSEGGMKGAASCIAQ